MSEKIDADNGAKAVCFVCGSKVIFGICHHCERYFCEAHAPIDNSNLWIKKAHEYKDIKGFRDTRPGEKDYLHCRDHKHYVKTYHWLLPFLGALIAIIFLNPPLFRNFPTESFAGSVFAIYLILKSMEGFKRRLSDTMVPLSPAWDFKIAETITRNFTIGEKTYSEWKDATGKFTAEPSFTEAEKERYDSFLKSYFPTKPRKFELGVIGIENINNTSLRENKAFNRQHLRLIYTAKDYQTLQKTELKREYSYEITNLKSGKKKFTFWLVPHLCENSSACKLEIHLIFPTFSKLKSKLNLNKLEVAIPLELGRVTDLRVDDRLIGIFSQTDLTAHWEGIPIKAKDTVFQLKFTNPITGISQLSGKYDLGISGEGASISGLEAGRNSESAFFSDIGEMKSNSQSTKIEGEFTIKTSVFIDESSYLVSQNNIPELKHYPDHYLVDNITKALADSDVYIKRLTETASWPTLTLDRIKNRFWSFWGRVYHNIYPVDIHLSMQGQEMYDKNIKQVNPRSKIEFTVSGTTAGTEMRDAINSTYHKIEKNLLKLLEDVGEAPPSTSVLNSPEPEINAAGGASHEKPDTGNLTTARLNNTQNFPEDQADISFTINSALMSKIKQLRAGISALQPYLQNDAQNRLSTAINAYHQRILTEGMFNDFLERFETQL